MNIEIIEQPIRFHLHGISGVVENERYGEVGMSLMNEMWRVVKEAKIPTTGINHWVYLLTIRCSSALNSETHSRLRFPSSLSRWSSS